MVENALMKHLKNSFICKQASDGDEAVSMVQQDLRGDNLIRFVIMDYQMPHMNGPEATLRLRQLGYSGPVHGLTGNMIPDDIKKFLEHGADEVHGKPLYDVAKHPILSGTFSYLMLPMMFNSFCFIYNVLFILLI